MQRVVGLHFSHQQFDVQSKLGWLDAKQISVYQHATHVDTRVESLTLLSLGSHR